MALDTFVPPFTISSQALQTSNTTWAQLKAGGWRAVLDNLVAANTALANPSTQATVAPTGGGTTGGSLAAGTYYASYTWLDALGETTVGTSESSQFTVSAGNKPRVTIPSLPTGAVSANIYVTPVGGAAGSETLYGTGCTTTTYDLITAATVDMPYAALPAVNTTGGAYWTQLIYSLIFSGQGESTLYSFNERLSNYLSGNPMQRRDVTNQARLISGVLAYWWQVATEVEKLVINNMPTAAPIATQDMRGMPVLKWTLP